MSTLILITGVVAKHVFRYTWIVGSWGIEHNFWTSIDVFVLSNDTCCGGKQISTVKVKSTLKVLGEKHLLKFIHILHRIWELHTSHTVVQVKAISSTRQSQHMSFIPKDRRYTKKHWGDSLTFLPGAKHCLWEITFSLMTHKFTILLNFKAYKINT